MESTALAPRLPIPLSRSCSKPVSPSPFAGARRLAAIPLSCCSGREYASAGSSVFAAAAAASGEAADAGSEAILLSVQRPGPRGMMCDGCAASVKRILESQPEVTSATVDFKQVIAIVWTTAEAKASEDWQKHCGEKLAKHLGTCGFESSLQGE